MPKPDMPCVILADERINAGENAEEGSRQKHTKGVVAQQGLQKPTADRWPL
jgi:hypothetical protein